MPRPDRSSTTATRSPAGRADGLHHISRVDSGRTHGWLVRFQRDGDKWGRLFSDGPHGGPEAARDAARQWRDETLQRVGPTPVSDASRMHTQEARRRNRRAVSRTGVTGIGVVLREFSAQRVPYVTAYWIDADGRRRQTSFSVQRHGVDDALRLAARARAGTAEWHGEPSRDEQAIYDLAVDRVRELVAPHLASPPPRRRGGPS